MKFFLMNAGHQVENSYFFVYSLLASHSSYADEYEDVKHLVLRALCYNKITNQKFSSFPLSL